MANVSFFDPSQEQEIKRRRRMAAALQKNSGPKTTEMVSGFAVPQSGLEQLVRGLSGGLGSYQDARADTGEQDLAKSRQALLSEALGKLDTDQKGAGAMLAQDPSMLAAGLGLITDANKTDRAQILADAQFQQKQQLATEAAKNARIAAGIKAGAMGVDAEGNPMAPVGGTPDQKALDVKKQAFDLATKLLNNQGGVEANRGFYSKLIPNTSAGAIDAEADLETMASLLTTENLGLLKGVLSDTDMRVLKDIGAGKLKGSDASVIQGLKDIRDKLGGQTGQRVPIAPVIPEGSTATNPQTGEKLKFTNGQWGPL